MHPWAEIDLGVYEQHMGDARVGQLQQLHQITRDQLTDYPARRVGVLGVAGGNGLDLLDPATVDAVFGFDINADYLAACETRYHPVLGDSLRLVETSIDRSVRVEPVDLLIANLIVEYVGAEEFGAFAAQNAEVIGVLSCVVQRNDAAGFASSTEHTSVFAGVASVASEVAPEVLDVVLRQAGFASVGSREYPLPNGKTLVRQDYRPI